MAFSPDGQWLAAVEGAELVVRRADETLAVVSRRPLAAGRPRALQFAGATHLALLEWDALGDGILRTFSAPGWSEQDPIEASGVSPQVLIGHPEQPWVLLGPRLSWEWGQTPEQERSNNHGFVAYNVASGAPIGGAGPIGSAADFQTLTWRGEQPTGMRLGTLRTWSLKTGAEVDELAVADGTSICQVIFSEGQPSVLGWASPPRVQVREQTFLLDDLGDVLYHLSAGPGGVAVAIVVSQEAGRVQQVTAQSLADGRRTAHWPLAWPTSTGAIHPQKPWFAWVEGSIGHNGALRVVNLSDGRSLR